MKVTVYYDGFVANKLGGHIGKSQIGFSFNVKS